MDPSRNYSMGNMPEHGWGSDPVEPASASSQNFANSSRAPSGLNRNTHGNLSNDLVHGHPVASGSRPTAVSPNNSRTEHWSRETSHSSNDESLTPETPSPTRANTSKRAKKFKTAEQRELDRQRREQIKAEKALIVSGYNKAQRAMFQHLRARPDANGIRSNRRGRPLEVLPPRYDYLANIADEDFDEESLGIVDDAISPVTMEKKVELLPSFLCSKWGFFVGGIKKIAGMSYEEMASFVESFSGNDASLFEDYVREKVTAEESKAKTAERNQENKTKREDHGFAGFPPKDRQQQNLGNNAPEGVFAQANADSPGPEDNLVAAMEMDFHQPSESFAALPKSNAVDPQLPGASRDFPPTSPSPIWISLNNGSTLKQACRDQGYDPQVYLDTLNHHVVAEYARLQAIGDGHGEYTNAVEQIRLELMAVFENRQDHKCIPDWLHQRVALELGPSKTASGS